MWQVADQPWLWGLPEAAQKRSHCVSEAGLAALVQQCKRRSSWPAYWHALNEHPDQRRQGHRLKIGCDRAVHTRGFLPDQSRAASSWHRPLLLCRLTPMDSCGGHSQTQRGPLHSTHSDTRRRQLPGHVLPPLRSKHHPEPQTQPPILGRDVPSSPHHWLQPRTDRVLKTLGSGHSQHWTVRNRVGRPSSLSKRQEETLTGLLSVPSVSIPSSVHTSQAFMSYCCQSSAAWHSKHSKGQTSSRTGPKTADRSSVCSVLSFQLVTGTKQYHTHHIPMYFH